MADTVKTLILRFRDLVTPSGGTIAAHRALIRTKGYTWWGWWNKKGERVAGEEALIPLKEVANASGLDLYLLDSDRRELYGAGCDDIRWDAAYKPIPSPDVEATPAYYSSRDFLCWFRLTKIDATPVDPAVLHGLSYVRIDSFFTQLPSPYETFYGKHVASIPELVQQNRSVWFVRDARPNDPEHEIQLLEAARIEPSNFPSSVRQSVATRLLWLSDVHFSDDPKHHAFPETADPTRKPLAYSVERALDKFHHRDIAGMLISGDLTWKASPTEFDKVYHFIDGVKAFSKLNSYDVLLCPGNHDIAFSADPAVKDAPVTVAPDEARKAFVAFYRRMFYLAPNEYLCSGRRFLLGNAIAVEVIALNTSLLKQKPGAFQGQGFVGDDQLTFAAEQMGWRAGPAQPRARRIVMMHHHLLPITYRENPVEGAQYSVTLDAEAVARWMIDHRVDLVLHGHMHQPFCATVQRPRDMQQLAQQPWPAYTVIALGSSGVSLSHVGESAMNLIGVLDFSRDSVRVDFLAVHPVNEPKQEFQRLTIRFED
jgi:3',5'-cyclic AMP phosphodiesterase CpdA